MKWGDVGSREMKGERKEAPRRFGGKLEKTVLLDGEDGGSNPLVGLWGDIRSLGVGPERCIFWEGRAGGRLVEEELYDILDAKNNFFSRSI